MYGDCQIQNAKQKDQKKDLIIEKKIDARVRFWLNFQPHFKNEMGIIRDISQLKCVLLELLEKHLQNMSINNEF
jgi:hypothetical protein